MPDSSFRKRLLITVIALGIGGIALVVQFAAVMLGQASGAAGANTLAAVERGAILDRNGRLLAIQTAVYSVAAQGPNIKDSLASAQLLAPILETDSESIYQKLANAKGAVILKNGLNRATADKVKALMDSDKLPAIYLEESESRAYPEGAAAAQVIGFTGVDNEGLEGIEYEFEKQLSDHSIVLSDGRAYGNQVYLTLDMPIQHAMEKLADKAAADYSPSGFMLIVADAANADILAYVVRPSYNPNTFRDSKPDERRNLPLLNIYEPGSVFKVFSISSIMQLGGINDSTLFHTTGGYTNKLFRDPITDLSDYGTISAEGVIKYSSNVGAAFASDTVSADQFSQMLRTFGFGSPTNIDLNGEESGLIQPVDKWSPRTKPTIAIGQEIGVTAIQMLSASTALANDGTLLRPHIVKRIVSPTGKIIQEFEREPVRQVLSAAVARQMLGYMHAATDDSGTGKRLRIEGIDISAKTGTAQLFDPELKAYSSKDFISSSMGLFPTQQPRVVMYVVLIKPRGEYLGGRIAAPILREAAEFIIPYLGINRVGDQVIEQNSQLTIAIPELPSFDKTLPDFRGLPKRSLLPLYLRSELKVEIVGEGRVVSQDPAPGTPVTEGLKLRLTLGGGSGN